MDDEGHFARLSVLGSQFTVTSVENLQPYLGPQTGLVGR